MNQILNGWEDTSLKETSSLSYFTSKKIFFKIFLVLSIILIIGCIFYFMHTVHIEHKNQELSQQMLENFNITTLYSNSSEYETNLNQNKQSFVLGMIEIPEIDVHYPILSDISEENLKIAPCKFYGTFPNQVGNLCIAAHNYRNYKFFSRLNDLDLNSAIYIYDSYGNKICYLVYDKYITDSSYLECTNQNTNGEKEITLVTCNKPDNSKRIIVKAKEKK